MKKTTAIMLLLTLGISLVFATGAKEVTARPEVVKLQVWYAISGASGEQFLALAKAFDASRPDIELELTYSGSYADTATKVSAALLSGDEPDAAIMAAGQLYTGGRGDFSMEDLVKDADFNVNDIFKGMLEYGMFEGRVAAVPYGISSQVLYYNKDITDAAGLDLEKSPPTTWAQFFTVAKTAMERGNVQRSPDFFGFDTSDGVWLFKSMLGQNGNEVVRKVGDRVRPVFQETSGVEVGTFWKSLVDANVMPAGQHNNAEKKFLAGNLAFIAASSNRVARWKDNTNFALGAIVMPGFKNRSIALGGNVGVILTSDQYKRDASWQLLKYLLEEENHTEFALSTGYLPVRKSAQTGAVVREALASNPLYKVAFDQLENAWAYYHFQEMGTMDAFFWYALDEIEKGVSSVEVALAKAAASLEKEIE
ncbi:MAG: ABC transporter substrate-binding protein [Sphaerochaeta sp.]|jgi:sn-glycerol 3-phosphate transport system substrate-binding protein|nr:ABC transporter substrate-binding protein [Sphaerochaeta sp.]MDX9914705.1 ABC transporter substrate-binding protein [Sphaerochaeta sp.]